MIDISGIRFQFTSSTGLYLSLLFPYEVFCSICISFSLYCGYSFIFLPFLYLFVLCYPILKSIVLLILSRHIRKPILFSLSAITFGSGKYIFCFHLQILFLFPVLSSFSSFRISNLIRETHLTVRWTVPPSFRFFEIPFR